MVDEEGGFDFHELTYGSLENAISPKENST